MEWHERKYVGLALRLAGLILGAIAWRLGHHLFAIPDPRAKLRPLSYLLALVWVMSACAGSALAVLGRHLFDPVELPARWRIHPAPRKAGQRPACDRAT
jgi:hypothetical protein